MTVVFWIFNLKLNCQIIQLKEYGHILNTY
jgi:hypothetical protein